MESLEKEESGVRLQLRKQKQEASVWNEAEEGVRGDCIMCSPGKEDVPFPED